MTFDPDRVGTVTFDSYSTHVDVDSVERALAERVPDSGSVARLWRSRSLSYTLVANHVNACRPFHVNACRPFYEVNRAALEYALAANGVDLPADEREAILATYHDLDVFDDVREGIERLRDGGYDVAVLSNGNPGMLASMVERADVGDLVGEVVSADEVGAFEPTAELYRHAAARTGRPIDEIAHVSAAWFDVLGARHAGMQAVRLDRKGDPAEPFGPDPDLVVETIHELADELGV